VFEVSRCRRTHSPSSSHTPRTTSHVSHLLPPAPENHHYSNGCRRQHSVRRKNRPSLPLIHLSNFRGFPLSFSTFLCGQLFRRYLFIGVAQGASGKKGERTWIYCPSLFGNCVAQGLTHTVSSWLSLISHGQGRFQVPLRGLGFCVTVLRFAVVDTVMLSSRSDYAICPT
jgi:hypothetical protein